MARRSRRINAESKSGAFDKPQYRVAIYARLSGSMHRESDSIKNQINYIRNYVSKENTMSIYREYSEEGYSGTNFNRPAFTEMLTDARKGCLNCIIVKDLSRLGRNYIETGYFLETIFPEMNIRFIAINDQYDSDSQEASQDFLLLGLKNLINEMYAKDISLKRSTSYHLARKEKTIFGAMPPYGYIIKENRKEGFRLDPETAPIVQKIYDLYLQGMSCHTIAKLLNEEDITPPYRYYMQRMGKTYQNGALWRSATISNILSNPVYTGVIVRNKTKTSKYENLQTIRNAPEEWEIIPHAQEAIIHPDVYEKVKIKKETKRRR